MDKYFTYLLTLIISMDGFADFEKLGPEDTLSTPLPLPYDEKEIESLKLDRFINLSNFNDSISFSS